MKKTATHTYAEKNRSNDARVALAAGVGSGRAMQGRSERRREESNKRDETRNFSGRGGGSSGVERVSGRARKVRSVTRQETLAGGAARGACGDRGEFRGVVGGGGGVSGGGAREAAEGPRCEEAFSVCFDGDGGRGDAVAVVLERGAVRSVHDGAAGLFQEVAGGGRGAGDGVPGNPPTLKLWRAGAEALR